MEHKSTIEKMSMLTYALWSTGPKKFTKLTTLAGISSRHQPIPGLPQESNSSWILQNLSLFDV